LNLPLNEHLAFCIQTSCIGKYSHAEEHALNVDTEVKKDIHPCPTMKQLNQLKTTEDLKEREEIQNCWKYSRTYARIHEALKGLQISIALPSFGSYYPLAFHPEKDEGSHENL
jgi:hypothetical protein